MTKKIKTPFKDLNGETIKVGDIIIFGLLCQHWQVKKSKGKFIIKLVDDYYWEDMEGLGLDIPENNTYICKEGCYTS